MLVFRHTSSGHCRGQRLLFPERFTADLQIDQQGRYRFTYIGKLTDVSMARQLALKVQGLGLQKRVEIAERDCAGTARSRRFNTRKHT